MSSNGEAFKLLKESRWFHACSDDLLEALASKMVLIDAPDGHIFIEEGSEILQLLVLESGKLMRTKFSVAEGTVEVMKKSIKGMQSYMRKASMAEHAIVVDYIQDRASVTGFLHNIEEGDKAFATVSSVGESKVWVITGEEFRSIITSKPTWALEVMQSMSNQLRTGSKSLRGIMKHVKRAVVAKKAGVAGALTVCRVLCYDATSWVTDGFKPAVEKFNIEHASEGFMIEMEYTTERLNEQTATFAAGYDAVCLFVNDTANADVLQTLSLMDVKMIAMRCAGFDRVDTKAARAYGLTVARVPAYSPYAVAEMGISLLMAVNRKITKANNRVKMANFTLDTGLMGMDIHGKTVGVMGTGKIGQLLCNIILGFGAKLICYDVFESDYIKEKGGVYVSQEEIFAQSDVLFLMMPLLPATHHTINDEALTKLKKGVILINTSRGGLVDTKALLKGLQSGVIAGVGMDVYENEADYFFQDWSARNVQDPDLVALLGNNKVILTAHQAFFTEEAVDAIVSTTIENIRDFKEKGLTGQHHPNNCIPEV